MLLLAVAAVIRFADVAAPAGLDFVLDNGMTPEKHMIETMAGGMAAFDFDSDGRIDLFFTNGASIPSMKKEPRHHNRLYRNITKPGGPIRFTDVTAAAGLAGSGYSMGASVGDYDADGHPDLFVAGVYDNRLYRNLGNGRFADVTAASGLRSNLWSVGGGWFDYDADGRLDLLVVNYSNWSPKNPRFCGDTTRALRVYCHPKFFDPVPNQLYRNLGNGKFEEVTASSGIGAAKGRGMSVVFADYDADGHTDAFVTNDNLANFLFRNLGNGKFEETALLAGVALLDNGKPVASMGADFQDADGDGRPDLIVTALAGETFPFFRNQGDGGFRDATFPSRVGPHSARHSGWGVALADFNNDGLRDIFAAQSHVNDIVEKFEAFAYREPNAVYANLGDGKFRDDSATFTAARAHRGSAVADFDNDGRLDIAVSVIGERAELWRNVTEPAGNWIGVRVRESGATVTAAGHTATMHTSAGYVSSVDAPLHFGLGTAAGPVTVKVRWPDGRERTIEKAQPDRVLDVRPN